MPLLLYVHYLDTLGIWLAKCCRTEIGILWHYDFLKAQCMLCMFPRSALWNRSLYRIMTVWNYLPLMKYWKNVNAIPFFQAYISYKMSCTHMKLITIAHYCIIFVFIEKMYTISPTCVSYLPIDFDTALILQFSPNFRIHFNNFSQR